MIATFSVSCMPKRLVSYGFAVALGALLCAAPAGASSLSDYYRTMYTMKFCNMSAGDSEGDSEVDVEQDIRLPVDQEFIDVEATSEDVAPIFDQLNAEYNANPAAFCEHNTAAAQEVIDDNN